MSDDGGKPLEPPEWVTKALATLDAISGYTFTFLALAGAIILWAPSPLLGVDLSPIRSGWGAWLLVATILCLSLALGKMIRALHASIARSRRERTARQAAEVEERRKKNEEEAARREHADQIRRRCDWLSASEKNLVAFCLLECRQSITMPVSNPTVAQLVHKRLLSPGGGGRMSATAFTFPDDVWEHIVSRGIDAFLPADRGPHWEIGLRDWAEAQRHWMNA